MNEKSKTDSRPLDYDSSIYYGLLLKGIRRSIFDFTFFLSFIYLSYEKENYLFYYLCTVNLIALSIKS